MDINPVATPAPAAAAAAPAPAAAAVGVNAPSFGSRTDIGYVREHNEDSLLVAPPLFVVCDGMGGHEAGEIASEIAIQSVAHAFEADHDGAFSGKGRGKKSGITEAEALGRAVEEANLAILNSAANGVGREGMGTTCTAAILRESRLSIAQVGDSRAYLMHDGILQQITRDHSVVADLVESGEISPLEARTHQWRSYITRALGLDPFMQADIYELGVSPGDRLVLCSDGLYSMIDDDEIAQLTGSIADPQACADALVEAALAAGGSDNVTVVVADASAAAQAQQAKVTRKAKRTAVLIVACLIVIFAAVAAGFGFWINNAAYLSDQEGYVAICRGVPGQILGFEFGQVEETTDIPLASLQPGVASRIASGDIRCDSIDAARELVDEYRADIATRTGAVPKDVNE